jgi:hypothetical protein
MALARALPLPQPQEVAVRHAGVSRAEWRWLYAAAGLLLLLTAIPPVVAQLVTPAGTVFSGYVVIARDAFVYQQMWQAGWAGAWLFHPAFTSETLPGVLIYPWYLWTGHLVGFISGPSLYHVARLVAAAALLLAIYRLCAELFSPVKLRRWAFVLASLGGGIGLLIPGFDLGPLHVRATEMASPGSSAAELLSMAPHLPAALALMCWAFTVALRTRRLFAPIEVVSAVAALVGLELIYPQLALLALLVIAGWAIGRRARGGMLLAAAGALACAPYFTYIVVVLRTTPEALRVIRPSLEAGDPLGFIVLSHLVCSALILIAIRRGRLRSDQLLPALWIVGMTVFVFVPGLSGVVGRSFMGSSIPFGLCAAPGLLVVVRGVVLRRRRGPVLVAILAASSLFGIFSVVQPLWIASLRLDARAEYESAGEASLLAWLAPQVTSTDVVLTRYLDGVFVPAQTHARVFVGHPDQTIDAANKADQATAFFMSWSVERRIDFLRANGIDYVLTTSPIDRASLAADPHLIDVQETGAATVFKVRS